MFGDKRVSRTREFFTADPELARLIIDLVKVEDSPLSDTDQGITEDQRSDIESENQRLTYERLGPAPGAVLQFIKDPAVTCEVDGPTTGRFRGELISPSAAAPLVLHEPGYTWSRCAGPEYWTYQGVKLSALVPIS